MQARGRRRHRAIAGGEHGLIVRGVGARVGTAAAFNIGRQRHPPICLQAFEQALVVEVEIQHHLAAVSGQYPGAEAFGEGDHVVRAQSFGRFGKSGPATGGEPFVQGRLDPRGAAPTNEP